MSRPRAGGPRGRARDAGGGADRPRLARGRGRARARDGQGRRQAADRLRALRRRGPPGAAEGLRAPDAARRGQHWLREPDQARLGRLPRGLLLQAPGRLGAARAALAGSRRAFRLPLRPRLQGARGEPARRRARRPRPPGPGLRPRLDLRRDAERRPRHPAADQPVAGEARRGSRAAAGRDRRRPLPPPRGREGARGAALHPVGRLAQEPEPLEVRHRPVLLQDAGRDGARFPRPRRGNAAHARDRRALQRDARAREHPAAEVPAAGRQGRVRVSGRALRERPAKALRPGHAGATGAPPLRAQDDQGDGLRRLLPDRLGLHRLRQAGRGLGRAGPRFGGRVARRLLPRDHRRRPDPLRPPLRALPQPGPQVDAGHGHRLRRRRARPGHQLRRGEVRARPRGPDHHLRDDDGPRRRPRRRSRARGPLRLRRQGREDDPGRPEGLPRRVPQAGLRAEAGLRRRPARAGDRRPREATRGADPPGLDPRGRGRDLRPAVDRHRPAAAEGQRPGGRDAVRDVGRRGARPAEDGLPRPAQPRRDRQGGRAGRQRRHLQAPARRPCHLRDAAARRRDRRLPVRVVGHARGAAVGQADRVRGSDRARRPLPARRRWATSPATRSARTARRR